MTPAKPCHYCGLMHETICPRIKRVMYDRGTVQSVEFWAPGELPKEQNSEPAKVKDNPSLWIGGVYKAPDPSTPPLSSGEEE